MRDYYRLLDAFNRVPETGTPKRISPRIRVGEPFLELPTDENKIHIKKLQAEIAKAEVDVKSIIAKAFKNWRSKLDDRKSAERKNLPMALAKILDKAAADRTDREKKTIEKDLEQHFDEKVLAGVGGKSPAIARVASLKKSLITYKADQIPRVMIMSDAQPRRPRSSIAASTLSPGKRSPSALPHFCRRCRRTRRGIGSALRAG